MVIRHKAHSAHHMQLILAAGHGGINGAADSPESGNVSRGQKRLDFVWAMPQYFADVLACWPRHGVRDRFRETSGLHTCRLGRWVMRVEVAA